MSKDGLLPPGVETWHIPGNRPEDEAYQQAYEDTIERLGERLADGLTDAGFPLAVEEAALNVLLSAFMCDIEHLDLRTTERLHQSADAFRRAFEEWIESEVEERAREMPDSDPMEHYRDDP